MSSLKTFSADILKMSECHFLGQCKSRVQASWAAPGQKLQGLRLVCPKIFSMADFFVFWVTYLVNRFELFARETNLKKKLSLNCG